METKIFPLQKFTFPFKSYNTAAILNKPYSSNYQQNNPLCITNVLSRLKNIRVFLVTGRDNGKKQDVTTSVRWLMLLGLRCL